MKKSKTRSDLQNKVLNLLNDNLNGIRRSMYPGLQIYLILNAQIGLGQNEETLKTIVDNWCQRNNILYNPINFLG